MPVDTALPHLDDPQALDVAAGDPVVAETVVVAGHEGFGTDAADEVVAHEFRAGERSESAVEGDDDQVIEPESVQQADFLVERREQPQSFGAAQRDARMGFESQHDALAFGCACFGDEPADKRPMSEVHAVEGADRDDRVRKSRERIEAVKDLHRLSERFSR